MKYKIFKLYTLSFLVILTFTQFGQRFNNQIFNSVALTCNVLYTTAKKEALLTDIYEPEGMVETQRPIITLEGISFIRPGAGIPLCSDLSMNSYNCVLYLRASLQAASGISLDPTGSLLGYANIAKCVSGPCYTPNTDLDNVLSMFSNTALKQLNVSIINPGLYAIIQLFDAQG